jgi:D-alanyl-D-alanine carboxypeptidase/D-alanyl-D-alanine-endopeptidase (penicillin-binding protein 4)
LAAGAVVAALAMPAAADLGDDARTLVGADQGVHVEEEDGTVLVSQAADRAVHPASVSKVPTTLALLRVLGPDHRIATRFVAGGPVRDGVLHGDLVVEAGGDPYLVDENALLVLLALREAGVERVAGDLVARGPLLFNWETEGAAARLEGALAGQVTPEAWQAVRNATGAAGARAPGLAFAGASAAKASAGRALVVHRSQPMIPLVKALNGFSNNIFAPFARAVGGIAEVEAIARASVPAEMRDEIVLGDGAGAHARNRISPRAAVGILRALHHELAKSGHTLADVLPVAGIDDGTLRHRLDGPGELGHVVGKTGTYGSYGACALAGALRTRRGPVYFAILNRNVPIEAARRRQDAFVRALLAAFDTEPWPYRRDDAPAFTRAEVATR